MCSLAQLRATRFPPRGRISIKLRHCISHRLQRVALGRKLPFEVGLNSPLGESRLRPLVMQLPVLLLFERQTLEIANVGMNLPSLVDIESFQIPRIATSYRAIS